MENKTFEMEWGGRTLKVETGMLAPQANGSCLVTYGDTVVLATAVINKVPRDGTTFFPLMVDFEEKMYAAGRIKGSRFIKRETRPSDEAVLTARLIDRGLRPLFDEQIRNDIQVVITVLSIDEENDPDIPGIVGASIALHMSNIPWNGPITAIRVGQIEGEWVLNPTYEARTKSAFDLTVCYNDDKVINIEAGCNETDEKTMYGAFEFGLKHTRKLQKFIESIRKEVGLEKMVISDKPADEDETDENKKESLQKLEKLTEEAKKYATENIGKLLFNVPKGTKRERKETVYQLKDEIIEQLKEKQVGKDNIKKVLEFFDDFIEAEVTRAIIERDQRVDGRKLTEVRELKSTAGVIKRNHGSAIFNRGETQVFSVVTLGSPGDQQLLDGMEIVGKKRYMHHYNFPPYSVGEARPMRGPGRRDIGHGSLAEKALQPVLPSKEDFPYTIRVVSEVMSSNGSSSMASTCGSSLSLMDAGVPITKAVGGVAIGLASNDKGEYKILTDLQDLEDGKGGMDFKITGTVDGITAIQMDTKTSGLSLEIVEKALNQGKTGVADVIASMNKAIDKPRAEMSPFAPRIISIRIHPDKIRNVIGPGGKIINEIIEKTGVQIDIEDDGLVMITSTSEDGSAEAVKMVEDLTQEAEVGKTYTGKVIKIMDFGAFVEIFPGTEGMVHISEITDKERVNDVRKYLEENQEVKVKVIKIDELGRVNLSMKQAE